MEIEVDARGLYCPLPILRLAAAFAAAPAGTRARLLATDAATVRDVAAYCAEGLGTLLDTVSEERVFTFVIEKRVP